MCTCVFSRSPFQHKNTCIQKNLILFSSFISTSQIFFIYMYTCMIYMKLHTCICTVDDQKPSISHPKQIFLSSSSASTQVSKSVQSFFLLLSASHVLLVRRTFSMRIVRVGCRHHAPARSKQQEVLLLLRIHRRTFATTESVPLRSTQGWHWDTDMYKAAPVLADHPADLSRAPRCP